MFTRPAGGQLSCSHGTTCHLMAPHKQYNDRQPVCQVPCFLKPSSIPCLGEMAIEQPAYKNGEQGLHFQALLVAQILNYVLLQYNDPHYPST